MYVQHSWSILEQFLIDIPNNCRVGLLSIIKMLLSNLSLDKSIYLFSLCMMQPVQVVEVVYK